MKNEKEHEISVAYSYLTLAKMALIDAKVNDIKDVSEIIDLLSTAQVRLAPYNAKK